MFTLGSKIKVTLFGQSRGEVMGAVIDGVPSGVEIDRKALSAFMRRRFPQNGLVSSRKEADIAEFVSGLYKDRTCGAPLVAVIKNTDPITPAEEDNRRFPRPSHADFTQYAKFGEYADLRGGGAFSGRMTAPLCVAGFVCISLLKERGIRLCSHIYSVHGVFDTPFDPVSVPPELQKRLFASELPVISAEAGEKITSEVKKAAEKGDSTGGIIETAITGLSAGDGGTFFDGLEGCLSRAVFAVPGVKGIEFGSGFYGSGLYGSENNDPFYYDKNGEIKTITNNSGGILGGLATGMPIIFRTAIKPTPTTALPRKTVDRDEKANIEIKKQISGRNDPCVALRAAPAIEAAAALAIINSL